MNKYYINLTTGLGMALAMPFWGAVRIQSSHGEAKQWDKMLLGLDYAFLLDLAMGHHVIVIDASQRKPESRAIFQGVPWIRYALTRRWLGRDEKVIVKGMNVSSYFSERYNYGISKETKNKLDYVKKLVITDKVRLSGVSVRAEHDGNFEFYKNILRLTM